MHSIGQFAEIGGVSIKQLRYLEKKNILRPDTRNPENSYRYYSEHQLETLIYIKKLRELGFDLNRIAEMARSGSLDGLTGAMHENLAQVKREMADAVQRHDNIVEHLNRIDDCRAIIEDYFSRGGQSDVRVISVPRMRLISIRDNHTANVEQLFVDRVALLKKRSAEAGVAVDDILIAIFHAGYHDQFSGSYGDLETAYAIKKGEGAKVRLIRESAAFKGVSAIHVGHYRHMKPLYLRMESWAEEKGIALTGTAIEKYILGPDMTPNPDEYVTRLILPIS